MTEKLFYEDAFLQEFTAVVIGCEKGKNGWGVVLDRTAFYPEGGGQPADHGALGGAAVSDVRERDGVICHTCSQALEVGSEVGGRIDFDRRFDFMQQHSGEHIVSGILCGRFQCDNVGFHIGHELVTIDFNAELTPEDVQEVERLANQYIWEDRPVLVSCPTPEELQKIPYRSKKALTGQVRIVEFPGADLCACCGTHVNTAGQVGLVKLLSWVKFRSGLRIELVCGGRALEYLSKITAQNGQISQLLSAKPLETALAAERLLAENAALKVRVSQMEDAHFDALARQAAGVGNAVYVESGLSPHALRRLADKLAQTCGESCACASPKPEGGCHYVLACREGDVRPLAQALNQALEGRGGGKPSFVQGGISAGPDAFLAFFELRGFHAV